MPSYIYGSDNTLVAGLPPITGSAYGVDKYFTTVGMPPLARVSSIRHTYQPGLYKAELSFGRLSGSVDYEGGFDLIKERMRKDSLAAVTSTLAKELKGVQK